MGFRYEQVCLANWDRKGECQGVKYRKRLHPSYRIHSTRYPVWSAE